MTPLEKVAALQAALTQYRVQAEGVFDVIEGQLRELEFMLTPPPPPPPPPAPVLPPPPAPPSGRPGPDNTGVPPGLTLKPSASIIVTKDGTTIEGLAVTGQILVRANNTTIRNCLVRTPNGTGTSAAYPLEVESSIYTGTVAEDCEFDGNGRASVAVGTKNITLIRCNVHGGVDLVRADGNTHIVRSWIHDPARTPGSHNDGIQLLKGSYITVRDSYIDVYDEGDLPGPEDDDPHNACFIISAGKSGGPVDKITLEGNWFEGGNYGLYLGAGGTYPVTGVTVRNNRFAKGKFRYGAVTAVADSLGFDRTTNLYEDGTPVR